MRAWTASLSADLLQRLQESFARGHGYGLLQLGAAEVETALPPVLGYWREVGDRFVSLTGDPVRTTINDVWEESDR